MKGLTCSTGTRKVAVCFCLVIPIRRTSLSTSPHHSPARTFVESFVILHRVKRGENFSVCLSSSSSFSFISIKCLWPRHETWSSVANQLGGGGGSEKTHVNTPQLISLTPIIQSFHFHQLQNLQSFLEFWVGKTLLLT